MTFSGRWRDIVAVEEAATSGGFSEVDALAWAESEAPLPCRLAPGEGVNVWTDLSQLIEWVQDVGPRALRETDAFPASDVGLLRGAARLDGVRPTPPALLARAEAWRPWRGYAAQHLWAAGGARNG